jgi:hypothetical protein
MTARLRLRRRDGGVYLERWGIEHDRIGGVFLHKMSAPDPGPDLHDHPWSFVSLILWGGYVERRTKIRDVLRWGSLGAARGRYSRLPLSLRPMPRTECHRIIGLLRSTSWSLVIHGPRRQRWGFYTPDGFVDWEAYEGTARGLERGLGWHEI